MGGCTSDERGKNQGRLEISYWPEDTMNEKNGNTTKAFFQLCFIFQILLFFSYTELYE
jgi:hypothetical protein